MNTDEAASALGKPVRFWKTGERGILKEVNGKLSLVEFERTRTTRVGYLHEIDPIGSPETNNSDSI